MNLSNKLDFLDSIKDEIVKQEIIDNFHALYYYTSFNTWKNTRWMGIPIQKCPLDLFIYQEIIRDIEPDLIIETGTGRGSSSLFMAMMMDTNNKGRVITIDKNCYNERPKHHRVEYLGGDSISETVIKKLTTTIKSNSFKTVMVILDSDHTKKHVLKELQLYNKFVSKEAYLIVEDTNVNSNPVCADHGEGPTEAIDEFLKDNKDFEIDKTKEKFYLSFNVGGFLKKKTWK